jgi:hypothetical protein
MGHKAIHSLQDPAKLTPYEEKLVQLKNMGLSYKQMSEELGGKANAKSITARYKVIREKLELLQYEQQAS